MRWSGPEQQRNPFQKSAGPVNPARHVPPYFPISCSGLMTSGSCPMRSATGGSLPALTSAASAGASLKVLGAFAASVTTSGPSSLPIRELLPTWARAPAATTVVRSPITSAITNRDRRPRVCGACRRSVMTVLPCAARPPRSERADRSPVAPAPPPLPHVRSGCRGDTALTRAHRQAAVSQLIKTASSGEEAVGTRPAGALRQERYLAAAVLRTADAQASATSRLGSACPGNVAH